MRKRFANFSFSSNSFEFAPTETNCRTLVVCTAMHSSFHLALHSRINSLLAYFKVSFHSPISARARLVSGLSRFFVKKVYIYYEVIRRFSHAPQGCNVVLISRLLQLHLHARYDSSLASARSFLFSILLDSYLDFSLSIEKCYYDRLRVFK